MSRLSQTDRDRIKDAIQHLKGDELESTLQPQLKALRLWLDTWVIPPLQRVLDDKPREPYER